MVDQMLERKKDGVGKKPLLTCPIVFFLHIFVIGAIIGASLSIVVGAETRGKQPIPQKGPAVIHQDDQQAGLNGGMETASTASQLLRKGNALFRVLKYQDAIRVYQEVLDINGDDWAGNYQIAMSYLALYHPGSTNPEDVEYADKAIEGFERLMTLQAPDHGTEEKVRNYYVAVLRSADKMEKVIAYYEELLDGDPNNTSYIAQLAQIYAKKEDFPNAMKYYQLRADIEPQNKEAWYTIGVLSSAHAKDYGPTLPIEEVDRTIEDGIKAMDRALAIDPDYFDALVWEGILYRQKSSQLAAQMKNEEAGEAFAKAEDLKKRAEDVAKKRNVAGAPK